MKEILKKLTIKIKYYNSSDSRLQIYAILSNIKEIFLILKFLNLIFRKYTASSLHFLDFQNVTQFGIYLWT